MFLFEASLQFVQHAEPATLEFPDPAVGDFEDRHGIEEVQFLAPARERRLKIEEILYQPESAGDFNL